MKRIQFTTHVLPHLVAIAVFLLVTVIFFSPIFFENRSLNQSDIQQWEGSSKSMRDFREATGYEPLWTESMFSGMPGYLVNVQWGNEAVAFMKSVLAFKLPHPIANIYLAFLSYYILLVSFGIRPYLAIAGALAFGLSSYMIIGLSVGHSSRIGAIAFMPLVMAGIHLAFTNRRILGAGVTAAGLALHFRENHLQMTYYLLIIVGIYGLVQLVTVVREKRLADFGKTLGMLVIAALLAVGTFFGPMWAITEYTRYSRGKSELEVPGRTETATGLDRSYAFQYNYAILEPMTLLIPNFYGGTSQNLLAADRDSRVYQALARFGDEQTFNQLAYSTSAYWGPQTPVPYYAGAIVVFMFALGLAFAEKKFIWWLVPVCVLAVMMSWGSNFSSFNYFLFDHLPGYNKFRSVTFTVVMVIFAMPLLGMLGMERIMSKGISPGDRKKLYVAFGLTGGLCLFFLMFAGILSFHRAGEQQLQLPGWFTSALAEDRKGLLRSDAFRSLAFIVSAFVVIYFEVWKRISPSLFYFFLIAMIALDIAIVDRRYFTRENYKRKREDTAFVPTEADKVILNDKSIFRVYNLQSPFLEARTSYFHHSVGGYHGVKLRRYQDLYDSCLIAETNTLIRGLQAGNSDLSRYGVINMMNIKYIVFGPERNNVIPNPSVSGNAWFVQQVIPVASPTEELKQVCTLNTRQAAVVNQSAHNVGQFSYDSAATINLVSHNPNYLKYQSKSAVDGFAVFSEIFYPKGWVASIDGEPVDIVRANYVLRALPIPAGDHTIEFSFEPRPYVVGNKVTMISSWLVLITFLGCVGWHFKTWRES
jgi:hypothetical protein